jgi:serine/threonine protein kinase
MPLGMKSGDLIGGKYRLQQQLGTGAMGVVWEAINERTGRRVALKLILHSTEEHRRRLLREARTCGGLDHRNIVEIYDVGETEQGDPFLIMQLLTGETLGDLLKRKRRIEPPLAVRIGRDIASALVAAHEAKIIHRDLKPANIFLHRESNAGENEFVLKVLDFGVAKNLASGTALATRSGMIVGSPAYMSPEQLRADRDLDPRSDLWSLGIILFEMLVGMRPFHESSKVIVAQILTAPIPPVSSRVRQVPVEFDPIVARCLERDRMLRYQNAREVEWALRGFAEVSHPARTLVNVPMPPASNPVRPAMSSAPDVRPLPSGRPAMGSAPYPASGEPSEATRLDEKTAPLPGNERGARRALPSDAQAAGGERAAAEPHTGTQVLSPEAPIPSWRLEMRKALAASRQSSAEMMADESVEEMPQGGTLALSLEAVEQMAGGVGRDGTATTNAPLVEPEPSPQPGDVEMRERGPRREKRDAGRLLYATVGVGLLAIGALAVAFGLQSSTAGSPGEPPVGSPEVKQMRAPVGPGPSADPVVPARTPAAATVAVAEPKPPATARATAQPAIATVPLQASKAGAAPPAPTVAAKPAPASSSPAGSKSPKCGKFIKTNCTQ